MKVNFVFTVVFFGCTLSLFAQDEWAPFGAEWHYQYVYTEYPDRIGNVHYQSIGDSLIIGQETRKIKRTFTDYQGQKVETYFYSYKSDNKVWIWDIGNPAEQFELLYDFDLSLHDTIQVYFPYPTGVGFYQTLEVVSIDTLEIDGQLKRQWHFNNGCINYGPVIEDIGSHSGFLPYPCLVIGWYEVISLNCYSDDQINFQVRSDCDFFGIQPYKEWAPFSAEWNYGTGDVYEYPGYEGWANVKVSRDSVVLGRLSKVMEKTITSYDGEIGYSEYFTYQDEGVVYCYVPDQTEDFEPLYDFSAEIGDTVEVFSFCDPLAIPSIGIIKVYDIEQVNINGQLLKKWILGSLNFGVCTFYSYIEKMGNTKHGMFPTPEFIAGSIPYELFRCYQDYNLTYELHPECDYWGIVSGVKNVEDINFTIFPNPTNDFLNITDMDSNDKFEFCIYDHLGHEIMVDRLKDHSIDVSQLNPGIHFLKLMGKDGKSATTSFIKQ